MNSSPLINISESGISISMPDGRHGFMDFSQWPRLSNASPALLNDYYLCDEGIHWPGLDEDITFECILNGGEKRSGLYSLFMQMPWLNVSALARKMGISPSLMAQYIGGSKRPSVKRLKEIENTIHALASDMAAIKLT